MKAFNVAAAILVIGAGAVGSYLIIKDSTPTTNLEQGIVQKAVDGLKTQDFLSENPLSWLNNSTSTSESGSKINSFSAGQKNYQPVNLTQLVAQSMFGSMQKMDQSGENPFGNLDPNNPESRKLIAEALNNFQNPSLIFGQSIDNKDLKILSDNSKEAKAEYIQNIEKINQKRFSDSKYQRSLEQIASDANNDCLGSGSSLNLETAVLYQNLTNDYLSLSIPFDWLDLHKAIINHFQKAHSVYLALADCSADPIKGYLAVKTLPQLTEKAQEVQKLLEAKAKEIL